MSVKVFLKPGESSSASVEGCLREGGGDLHYGRRRLILQEECGETQYRDNLQHDKRPWAQDTCAGFRKHLRKKDYILYSHRVCVEEDS